MAGTELLTALARLHAGDVDGHALVTGFRDAVVLVPTDGHDGVLTSRYQGIQWVYAFTDEHALARFDRPALLPPAVGADDGVS